MTFPVQSHGLQKQLAQPLAAFQVLDHVLCADMVLQGLNTVQEHYSAWAANMLFIHEEWDNISELTAALQVLEESGLLEGSLLSAVKQCCAVWLVSGPALPMCSKHVHFV